MHYLFPYNFVYWTDVKNHTKIKQKYYSEILEVSKEWDKHPHFYADFKSSFNNYNESNFNNKLIQDQNFLESVIWEPLDKLLQEDFFIFPKPKQSKLQELWFNVYSPGQIQEVHDHTGFYTVSGKNNVCTSFSGAYILHAEEENKTVFYQPGPCPGVSNASGVSFKAETVKEGQVIIFPSSLLHYVLPCSNRRTTISFNLLSLYS